MVRTVKREPASIRGTRSRAANNEAEAAAAAENTDNGGGEEPTAVERRVLRSKYLNVKHRISDEKDDISKIDSDKFKSLIKEVDNLHLQAEKPREQVADAETLLDITNTLVNSVRAHSSEGITTADLVNCLLRDFGQVGGPSSSSDEGMNLLRWKDVGAAVSDIFCSAAGCRTMVGPLSTEIKQRKPVNYRKRTRPTESSRPEELDETVSEEKTDTDKNMAVMFDILRRKRKVKLEHLILNRNSFAQTVENLFALSFLIKDGRAEISVDDKGCHLVSPRNAPAANAVLSGEVSYSHFVFRLDFKDWKLMSANVEDGEELMPHRSEENILSYSQPDLVSEETQATLPTTPIRKLSRNRGLVLQEQTVVEDSPEGDDPSARTAAIRRGKRKLI